LIWIELIRRYVAEMERDIDKHVQPITAFAPKLESFGHRGGNGGFGGGGGGGGGGFGFQ
jgi:hypothetical protein